MRAIGMILASGLVGSFVGVFTAVFFSGLLPGQVGLGDRIDVDGWKSNWSIGTEALDPYTKVWVSRYGLLALRRTEAVYFTKTKDSEGRSLTEGCAYQLHGGELPGSWWSITVYDSEGYLPDNEDGHLSVDAKLIGDQASWQVALAGKEPEDSEYWISTKGAGRFDVTLRIYLPKNSLLADPEATLTPPEVKRISCEIGS